MMKKVLGGLAAYLRWMVAATLIILVLPASAQVFNPHTFTLANGMKVIVLPNDRVPVVAHMVWYKVGAADEEKGKTGLAHFLEHLMFKGTSTVPAGQFSRIISQNGGQDNAFTSSDYTGYYQNIASDKLETVMRMEADRMINLVLDEESVLTERDVILEERRMRTDNVPGALLNEKMMSELFEVHPYHNPVIGWEEDIRGLTREDALAFYRKWYAPNNAILIVAGDATVEQVRGLAEKYYAPVPAREIPPRSRPAEPPHKQAARITLADERVQQPAWRRFYRAPSVAEDPNGDSSALEVLAEKFGGGALSDLYRSLVVEQELAVSAGVSYDSSALDATKFTVYAIPRPGVTMETLEEAVNVEIRKLLVDDWKQEDIDQAKQRLRAGVIYARDSLQGGALAFGVALTTGQGIDGVEKWPERIDAVQLEDVRQAAQRLFSNNANSVTGILLPKE